MSFFVRAGKMRVPEPRLQVFGSKSPQEKAVVHTETNSPWSFIRQTPMARLQAIGVEAMSQGHRSCIAKA